MAKASQNTPQRETLEHAQQRADRAQEDLQSFQHASKRSAKSQTNPEPARQPGGIEALRNDSMMAHLVDSLEAGKDIGHYGRLVFTMVASHFLPDEEILDWLTKDRDVDRDKAAALLRQVEARDYNPPRRDRILEWQRQQEFPILPNPDDPDCGNVYKSLKFPGEVYDHIQYYQEQKIESGESAA
ncbi:MAG TPA: hypothetical protein VHU44_12020 [Acidobacteriaceae bacterium]|jgi:hypothetical protein|nr:hypothetical protein [Acidobacteriaceae bacterium]